MIFIDAFLDAYYAYDFNHPRWKERPYTTQAQRPHEPNINLAHLGLNLKEDKWHGRLALQGGDSVRANTQLEANQDLGGIQEAYLGHRLASKTWLDAGIYLGNIGMESWISKNNFNYTRSLLLDYVPYYLAGLRLTHDFSDETHFEFHLMQGWQNISETNSAKAVGLQIKKGSFTYNNFLGDEKVYPHQKTRFRTYHNFIYAIAVSEDVKSLVAFDIGTQGQQENNGVDSWFATALTFQQKLSSSENLGYRLEYYADPHEANVETLTPHGFEVVSASINYDKKFSENVLWRSEIRSFRSRDKIYNSKRDDGFFVSSIALSFN